MPIALMHIIRYIVGFVCLFSFSVIVHLFELSFTPYLFFQQDLYKFFQHGNWEPKQSLHWTPWMASGITCSLFSGERESESHNLIYEVKNNNNNINFTFV